MRKTEYVLFMPVKVAVYRLGGPKEVAQKLGVDRSRVDSWCHRTRRAQPSDKDLIWLAEKTGISLQCFGDYYARLKSARGKKLIKT